MDEERIYLNDVAFTQFLEKEKKEMRWTTFVWTVQNYSKLKEDVMYYREADMYCGSSSIKLIKTQKLLFLILHDDNARFFVNFAILGRKGKALNEGIASEYVSGQHFAEFDRALLAKNNEYLVDDQLIVQCKYIEEPIRDVLTHVYPSNPSKKEMELDDAHCSLMPVFLDGICSDFKICVPSMEFKVHTVVLAARSDFFARIFEESVQTNCIEMRCNVSHLIVFKMIYYIYTAVFCETNVKFVLDLIELAMCLEVKHLVPVCSEFLSKNMTVDNVIDIFLMASKYQYTELQNNAFDFIAMECPELLENDEIKEYLNPGNKKIDKKAIQLYLSQLNIELDILEEGI